MSPRASAARSAPIATLSLKPKIAVGRSGRSSSEAAAASPLSIEKSDSTTRSGAGRTPAAASADAVAVQALGGGHPVGRAEDRADASVPEREQVLDAGAGAGRVRGRDSRDPLVELHARVDDDEGVAGLLERPQLRVRLLRQHQDCAVGRAVHQAVEQRHLALVLVEGGTEDDPHVVLVERLRRTRDDHGEVRGLEDRQRHADEPGPPARERPRVSVRAEAVLAHDPEHDLAGLRRDVGPSVDHARDRGDRDAGRARDLADRRPRLVAVAIVPRHRVVFKHNQPVTVTALPLRSRIFFFANRLTSG